MANEILNEQLVQELIDDIIAIGVAANGDDQTDVVTRLAKKYPSIQKMYRLVFENLGVAKWFRTFTAMQGSTLVDGDYALVADDSDDLNGIYIKENGAWQKSKYNQTKVIRELLADYYKDEVLSPQWEMGTYGWHGRKWTPSSPNRARLVGGKYIAVDELVTVECLNPEVVVILCTWDKDGNFDLGEPYSSYQSKKVEGAFTAIAKFIDGRNIVLGENLTAADFRFVRKSELKTDIEDFKDKVTQLDKWFAGATLNTLEWVNGSIDGAGQITDTPERLASRVRNKSHREKYTGRLRVKVNNPDQKISINLFDTDGKHIRYIDWIKGGFEENIDGYYSIVVAWDDFRDITPEDADITVLHAPKNLSYIEEMLTTVDQHSQAITDFLVNGTFDLAWKWEVGSFAATGRWWEKQPADRLRLSTNTKFNGTLKVTSNNPEMDVNIVEFDENNTFIRYNSYASSQEREINGYFNVLVRWKDDRLIRAGDADVSFTLTKEDTLSELQLLKEVIFLNNYPTQWEVGSFTGTGALWARPDRARLRMVTNSTRFTGKVKVTSNNPGMSINIVEFDENSNFIKYNSYAQEQEREINGYFNILVRWNDDRVITPEDADVQISLNKQETQTTATGNDNSLWYTATPQFSEAPFGHLIGKSLSELQNAFDALVDNYPYHTTKKVIGRTGDDLYAMHAYTLEPPYPEACIAITMHTHGNERMNPLGFFALLDLFSKGTPQHRFILWLRDKVKWHVVPFMSPRAVSDNRRETRGINLNRNFDFLFVETPDSNKGSAPYSLPEAQVIYDHFEPLKDEIMYHLDLHDIPGAGGNTYSHRPAHHKENILLNEQRQMRKHLAVINNGNGSYDYPFENGSVLSLFLGTFAIPSATPEHVTQWWIGRGLTPDQQVAKALEQTCGFLYIFKNYLEKKDTRNSAFYTRDLEVPFASISEGNLRWTKSQIMDAFTDVSILQKDVTDQKVFLNNGTNSTKRILLISGLTEDDNNADLTALRVVQRISKEKSVFVSLLKDCKLVVAPAISDGLTEAELQARVNDLITKHNPAYTILVEAAKLNDPANQTRVITGNSSYVTAKTKETGYGVYTEPTGLAFNIQQRHVHFKLANEISAHANYPHTVAKWVGLVLNDMASYYAEV